MIEISFIDTAKFDEGLFSDLLKLLPEQQRNDIARHKLYKTKLHGLFGKLLVLKYFSEKKLIINEIKKNQFGKPFIEGAVQFSISHSANVVAAAFSGHEIGLDVERVATRKNYINIAKRFFSDEEYNYINNSTTAEDAFFYLWTRKEAFFKARGTGLDGAISKYNCINDIVLDTRLGNEVSWRIKSLNIKNGFKAAFCQNAPIGEWKVRELFIDDFLEMTAKQT
jgi:4'-phosphopantetheinyl transferase